MSAYTRLCITLNEHTILFSIILYLLYMLNVLFKLRVDLAYLTYTYLVLYLICLHLYLYVIQPLAAMSTVSSGSSTWATRGKSLSTRRTEGTA